MRWKILQLGDLLDTSFSGIWGEAPGVSTVDAKVIKVSDISKNRQVVLEKLTPRSVPSRIVEKCSLKEGDIVVVKSSGSSTNIISGRSAYITPELTGKNILPSNFVFVLRPNISAIQPKYLWHFLETSASVQFVHSIVGGSTYPNIKVAQYLKMPVAIPVDARGEPDLTEQKCIATKLDEVFRGANEGDVLTQKDEMRARNLAQSITLDAFSDTGLVEIKLATVAEINPRKDFRTLKGSEDVSFVPMNAVDETTGTITRKQTRRVDAVSKGYTFFRDGDVIFAKITPCMENGKCAVAKDLKNGIGFGSTEFYVVRANAGVLPEYLWHFLRQESVREEAQKHFTGAAGHKRVPKEFLEKLNIPVPFKGGEPDLAEQKRIVGELDKVLVASVQLKGLLEKQRGNFTALRSSVLNKSFSMQT